MEFLFETMSVDAPVSAGIPRPPIADHRGLDKLLDMLFEAEHALIVAEECGRSVCAVERLVEISDLLAIPVVETRTAGYVNFPRNHPLHAGFAPSAIRIGSRASLRSYCAMASAFGRSEEWSSSRGSRRKSPAP
jgi:glyoxylate carboligase